MVLSVEEYAASTVNRRRVADYELKVGKGATMAANNTLLSDINVLLKDYNPGGGPDLDVPYFEPGPYIAIAYLNREKNEVEYATATGGTDFSFPASAAQTDRPVYESNGYTIVVSDILAISYGERWENVSNFNQGFFPSLRKIYGLEHATVLAPNFLTYCPSFNQPLIIPESITTIQGNLLANCTSFANTIEVNTNALPGSLAITSPWVGSPIHIRGVTLTGPYAQAWKDALPDRTTKPYRKLIVAE